MVLPIVAFWGFCKICAVAIGTGVCAHKITKSFNKHEKTKKEKLALKGKSLEYAQKNNKEIDERSDKLSKDLRELEQNLQKRNTEIKSIQENLKDKNLPNNKRHELEEQLASLLASQEDDEKQKQEILNELKGLKEQRKKNDNIIAGAGSESDNKHWIWELITLENILILGACYALYKIANSKDKEDRW